MENNNNKVEWKRLISHFYMKKIITISMNKSSHWERTSFHSLLFLAQITWRVRRRRYLNLIVSRLFEMKRRDVWRQSISRLCIICQSHSSTDRRLTSYAGISLSDLRCEVKREIHVNFKRNKASPFSPRLSRSCWAKNDWLLGFPKVQSAKLRESPVMQTLVVHVAYFACRWSWNYLRRRHQPQRQSNTC